MDPFVILELIITLFPNFGGTSAPSLPPPHPHAALCQQEVRKIKPEDAQTAAWGKCMERLRDEAQEAPR
jgi:hypothetical protein